eukprot:4511651-Prymnesium_polylepis.1
MMATLPDPSERTLTAAFHGNTQLDACKGFDREHPGGPGWAPWSETIDSCQLRVNLVSALGDPYYANFSVGDGSVGDSSKAAPSVCARRPPPPSPRE